MIRLLIHDVLAKRGWTAYRLSQEADITVTMAYRLADPDHQTHRMDLETLSKVCGALGVQPGKLLEYVPD